VSTTPDFTPTIPAFLRSCAERFSGREAIVLEERRETYHSLERGSAGLALGLLAAGVGKGTRVGLLFPNGPDCASAFFAIARIGAIAVPLSTFYQPRELAWTLRHADVHTLLLVDCFLGNDCLERMEQALPEIADANGRDLFLRSAPHLRQVFVWGEGERHWARHAQELERAGLASPALDDSFLRSIEADVAPADSLVIVYTSGSTSDPKGVLHTHGTLVRHSQQLAVARGLRASDRVWLPLPLFWIGGLAFGLLGNMHVGAASIFEERFEAGSTLELLERERVTISTGWPHTVKTMQAHPDFGQRNLSSIRDGETHDALRPENQPDPELRSNPFGMTETCGPHTYEDITRDLPEKLRGSFGIPLDGVEHKIVDPENGEELPSGSSGEICVRGWSLMQGLYKKEREECFDEDGYYHTGDAGHFEHGRLYFEGRLGDMIKTGGANVAPREIEALMLEYPEIMEAYVTGVPDPARGQLVAAAIVLKPDQKLEAEQLRARLKSQLSAYKLPRLIAFYEQGSLPYRANGKIDKPRLDALLAGRPTGNEGSRSQTRPRATR